MRFQKRQYPRVKVIKSEVKGWGLKNIERIQKEQFVIEYVGELITRDEYRTRRNKDQEVKEENCYYLAIDSTRMIDAGPKGNLARFMNHSCDPNCVTQKWIFNGDTRVGLFALKDIDPGSELTFNYQLETIGEDKKKCLCGAVNCSGLMGDKPKNKDTEVVTDEGNQEKRKEERRLSQGKDASQKMVSLESVGAVPGMLEQLLPCPQPSKEKL